MILKNFNSTFLNKQLEVGIFVIAELNQISVDIVEYVSYRESVVI